MKVVESDTKLAHDRVSTSIIGQTMASKKDYADYLRRTEAIDNIIILHGFIMVLAIGNAIRGFVEPKLSSGDAVLTLQPSLDVVHFLICVVFVIRFLLGDRSYLRNYKPKVEFLYILDMLNIIGSAILIAYASFLVRHPIYLYQMLTIIVLLEVLWLWSRKSLRLICPRKIRRTRNISGEDQAGIGISHMVSVLTLVCIGGALAWYWPKVDGTPQLDWEGLETATFAAFTDGTTSIYIFAAIFGLNTCLDVLLRIRSYFGGPDWRIVGVEA